MPLNSRQRAQLRSMANGIDTILYIGKEGIGPQLVKQAYDALEARELIKASVQENAPMDARQACEEICALVHAEPVQCIGRKFIIYRESRKPKIELVD